MALTTAFKHLAKEGVPTEYNRCSAHHILREEGAEANPFMVTELGTSWPMPQVLGDLII